MRRLFARISTALGRLAFWRKPAAADEAVAPPTANAVPVQEEVTGPDAAAGVASPPAMPSAGETVQATDSSLTPPSFLARLIAKLHRPKVEAPAVAPDEAEDETRPNHRVPALLSRKIVGIPAIGFALLAVVGTLAALLWQANREHASLEAKLQAVERELELAAPAAAPKAAAKPVPPASTASLSTTTARPARTPARSDCELRGTERVSLQLKDCIDTFNDATTRSRPPPQPTPTR